jgi:hypothetical protein
VDRAGLRRKLLKAQAEAGDIVLLFGDGSEALTHLYLAQAWAKRGADLRVPAPGRAAKVAMLGVLDWARRDLLVQTSRTKRSSGRHRLPGGDRPALGTDAGRRGAARGPRARQRPDPHQARRPAPPSPSGRTGSPSSGRRNTPRS